MGPPRFIAYRPPRLGETEMLRRAQDFHDELRRRRSVRHFAPDPIPRELIELAIRTAASAPSGANRQPWRFVATADQQVKRAIRIAAEREERKSYESRMPPEWLEALEPLGTGWKKPYLETAPWIVVVFEEVHGLREDGSQRRNYYVKESVGIACGLFVSAVHHMGLATLTHTPSPMGFLREILGRPGHERPFMLFPVGYPAADAVVPDIERKPLDEVLTWNPPQEVAR
jgi:nitroreductase